MNQDCIVEEFCLDKLSKTFRKKVTYLTFLYQVTDLWIMDLPSADSEIDEDVDITEISNPSEPTSRASRFFFNTLI
ncbi:hypothetical protein V1478_016910 [Vespula squamosa]|uniref:Uncharacterized protein n=1 Tax=Vespula squamosa TaxID=30214 RepID=A0ABD1ZYG5_VESSQ